MPEEHFGCIWDVELFARCLAASTAWEGGGGAAAAAGGWPASRGVASGAVGVLGV